MIKMRNVGISTSIGVLLLTLTLPMSAGAFGKSPSQSEVFDQPGKIASAGSTTTGDGGGTSTEKVPEPSSLLLLGIAIGAGALVAIWKRRGQTTEPEQAE